MGTDLGLLVVGSEFSLKSLCYQWVFFFLSFSFSPEAE